MNSYYLATKASHLVHLIISDSVRFFLDFNRWHLHVDDLDEPLQSIVLATDVSEGIASFVCHDVEHLVSFRRGRAHFAEKFEMVPQFDYAIDNLLRCFWNLFQCLCFDSIQNFILWLIFQENIYIFAKFLRLFFKFDYVLKRLKC